MRIDPDAIPVPARRLRELLESSGVSQKELAGLIHVDARYISMVACGRRGLSMGMAKRIADCFPGTRVQWLLGLDDFKTEDSRTGGVVMSDINTASTITGTSINYGQQYCCSRLPCGYCMILHCACPMYPSLNVQPTWDINKVTCQQGTTTATCSCVKNDV